MDPISAVTSIVGGSVLKAGATYGQGQAVQKADQYTANAMNVQAGQDIASSEREAQNQLRNANLAKSSAIADAAAGGGAADVGVMTIRNNLQREGLYRAQTAMYEGATAAQSLNESATLKRYEGNNAATAGKIGAITSVLSGAGSTLFSRYGGGGYSNYAMNYGA